MGSTVFDPLTWRGTTSILCTRAWISPRPMLRGHQRPHRWGDAVRRGLRWRSGGAGGATWARHGVPRRAMRQLDIKPPAGDSVQAMQSRSRWLPWVDGLCEQFPVARSSNTEHRRGRTMSTMVADTKTRGSCRVCFTGRFTGVGHPIKIRTVGVKQ